MLLGSLTWCGAAKCVRPWYMHTLCSWEKCSGKDVRYLGCLWFLVLFKKKENYIMFCHSCLWWTFFIKSCTCTRKTMEKMQILLIFSLKHASTDVSNYLFQCLHSSLLPSQWLEKTVLRFWQFWFHWFRMVYFSWFFFSNRILPHQSSIACSKLITWKITKAILCRT